MDGSTGYPGDVVLWPAAAAWSRTWRGVAAAALHPFLLVVTMTVTWTGLALAIGLLPLALAGVPVFGLTALACRGLSTMERSRARGTLGLVVEPPHRPGETTERWWWSGALRAARTGATWRGMFYHALALPLAGRLLCGVPRGLPA